MLKYILLMVISFNCFADDWTDADTNREIAYLTLHAMDWAQTRNIARNPDKWYETNPILGKHPSVDKVDVYFAFMAFAHYFVSSNISSEYRSTFQYATILFESGYVYHNVKFGVRVKF